MELNPLVVLVWVSFALSLPGLPCTAKLPQTLLCPKPLWIKLANCSSLLVPNLPLPHVPPNSPHLCPSCLALDPLQGPSLYFPLLQVCSFRQPKHSELGCSLLTRLLLHQPQVKASRTLGTDRSYGTPPMDSVPLQHSSDLDGATAGEKASTAPTEREKR